MNYKIALSAFSITLILSGCASLGQQGRIGKNDGSDSCYLFLEKIDSMAMYYKDERLKKILTGTAIGAVSGAALGIGASALTHSDLTWGAIIGGIAGGVTGAFVANSYWENRLKQANQQKEIAAGYVESDMREDIEKMNKLDNDISALIRCRTQRRDQIRKQYAEGRLTRQQAEQEWQKWGELINKDREEMKYVGEALDNIKKIEDSYHYAATELEGPVTLKSQEEELAALDLEFNRQKEEISAKKLKPKEKNKRIKAQKKEHRKKVSALKKQYASGEVAPKEGKLNTLVSSIHEKYESVNTSRNKVEDLAAEASNSNGFEHIESRMRPFYLQPFRVTFIS